MAHSFTKWDEEPVPQPSGSRRGSPPRKRIGVAVLDPSVPPRKEPLPSDSSFVPPVSRVAAFAILLGIAVATLFMLLAPFVKF